MEKISKRDKVNWQDCKKFKHFDNPLKTYEDIPGDTKNCLKNTEKCEKLRKNVSNSEAVAKHSFYPLIAFNIIERRISKIKAMQGEISFLNNKIAIETDKDKKKEYEERLGKLQKNFKSKINKTRPIRYASHSDGHIYAYYAREELLPRYESLIKKHNLEKEILAYRTIPDEYKNDEKFYRRSNVTMAKEIFSQIISRGCNCVALAYDLESYYDTIDHKHLKKAWCKVLGVDKLPPDHYNIYKSLTKYCYVDLKTICKYFNHKKYCCSPNGKVCGNCDLCKTPKTYKLPKTFTTKIHCLEMHIRSKTNFKRPGNEGHTIQNNVYLCRGKQGTWLGRGTQGSNATLMLFLKLSQGQRCASCYFFYFKVLSRTYIILYA